MREKDRGKRDRRKGHSAVPPKDREKEDRGRRRNNRALAHS